MNQHSLCDKFSSVGSVAASVTMNQHSLCDKFSSVGSVAATVIMAEKTDVVIVEMRQ